MKYTDYLTPDEILREYRAAAVEKLAEHHLSVTQFDGMLKKATVLADLADLFLKSSLFVGVPAGLLAHAIGRTSTINDRDTRKLQAALDYYRDAKQELINNSDTSDMTSEAAGTKKKKKTITVPVTPVATPPLKVPESESKYLEW